MDMIPETDIGQVAEWKITLIIATKERKGAQWELFEEIVGDLERALEYAMVIRRDVYESGVWVKTANGWSSYWKSMHPELINSIVICHEIYERKNRT